MQGEAGLPSFDSSPFNMYVSVCLAPPSRGELFLTSKVLSASYKREPYLRISFAPPWTRDRQSNPSAKILPKIVNICAIKYGTHFWRKHLNNGQGFHYPLGRSTCAVREPRCCANLFRAVPCSVVELSLAPARVSLAARRTLPHDRYRYT